MKRLNLFILMCLMTLSSVFSIELSAQVSPFEYCYKMIRVKMLRKKMEFKDASGSKVDDGFNNYNGEFSKLSKPIYSYTQSSKVADGDTGATELILKYEGDDKSSLEYTITSNSTADTEYLFGIKMVYEKAIRTPFIQISITQNFKVDKNCRQEVVSSERVTLAKVAKGQYQLERAYTAYDQTDNNVSRLIRTVDGSNLLNEELVDEKDAVRVQNQSGYVYLGEDSPLPKLKIVRLNSEMKSGLDSRKTVELSRANAYFSIGNEVLYRLNIGFNETSERGIVLAPTIDTVSYTVDYWIWITKTLNVQQPYLNHVSSNLKKEDFEAEAPLKIHVKSEGPLQYKRLGAYWKVDHQEITQDPLKYTYFLSETNQPYMHSQPASAKELEDTAALEFKNPEIQTLVGEILSLSPKTREDKVRLILEVINSLIKYDDSMVQGDTVRLLKSTDILKKQTGVCQHYAVLFVSLARAMKVPAIVVSGYRISEKGVVGHAWVEYEKTPGLWVAVEPQSLDVQLYRTHTYLPLGRDLAIEQGVDSTETWENAGAFLKKMEIQKRE